MNIPLEGEPISPLIALRNCTLKSEKEKKKKNQKRLVLKDMVVVAENPKRAGRKQAKLGHG